MSTKNNKETLSKVAQYNCREGTIVVCYPFNGL